MTSERLPGVDLRIASGFAECRAAKKCGYQIRPDGSLRRVKRKRRRRKRRADKARQQIINAE